MKNLIISLASQKGGVGDRSPLLPISEGINTC